MESKHYSKNYVESCNNLPLKACLHIHLSLFMQVWWNIGPWFLKSFFPLFQAEHQMIYQHSWGKNFLNLLSNKTTASMIAVLVRTYKLSRTCKLSTFLAFWKKRKKLLMTTSIIGLWNFNVIRIVSDIHHIMS